MKQLTDTTWQSDNGLITFIQGNCMDFMAGCKENEFELSITDSPYGINEDGSKNKTRGKLATSKNYKGYSSTDLSAPEKHVFDKIIGISKNQIIWGANHFISKIPFDSSCWIVWNKENGEIDFADCELAWTSFKTAVRMFTWKWQGMLQQNMKNKQQRIHPNEKPIDLYRWIFTNYAKPTDKILDCFGGSMSSAIAAHMEGLRMTIIELDPEYFHKAITRFATYEAQQTIKFD